MRIIDKYILLLPPVKGNSCKHNFYLSSLEKTTPAQWYSNQVVGLNTLHETVGEMLKDSRIQGFVSNHSFRRSGASRLFHPGVDKKVIREYTGHQSDALNQYQVTSEEQKRHVSDVIAGKNIKGESIDGSDSMACICKKKHIKSIEMQDLATCLL